MGGREVECRILGFVGNIPIRLGNLSVNVFVIQMLRSRHTDTNIRLLSRIICWDLGYAFDPDLDCICDMRYDLNGFTQVGTFDVVSTLNDLEMWYDCTFPFFGQNMAEKNPLEKSFTFN